MKTIESIKPNLLKCCQTTPDSLKKISRPPDVAIDRGNRAKIINQKIRTLLRCRVHQKCTFFRGVRDVRVTTTQKQGSQERLHRVFHLTCPMKNTLTSFRKKRYIFPAFAAESKLRVILV